ncbi:uncharacterized protein LOC122002716 [Zingiber officinale]|nr:uncharacterized protein LOC122002716 [Zingiber officinale]
MDSAAADSSAASSTTSLRRDHHLSPASDAASPPPHPPSPARVKLMVSYGGRIQPCPQDATRLSYVGGESRIVALDRSTRLPALLAKLASLLPSPAADPLALKYQLPGEGLDVLISIAEDDDLEHLMAEYDRLQQIKPAAPRLRLFLFPVRSLPPRPSAALLDALLAVQKTPSSADFLFGFDQDFVPPPAVKVTTKEIAPPPLMVVDSLPREAPAKPSLAKADRHQQQQNDTSLDFTVAFSSEEIQKMKKIAANPPPLEHQVPRFPEKSALSPHPSAPYCWVGHTGGGASVARYASFVPTADLTMYMIPALPGGFYAPAASQMAVEPYPAVTGWQVAYDSTGRVVFHPNVAPTYPTVTSVSALSHVDAVVKALQPSEVS